MHYVRNVRRSVPCSVVWTFYGYCDPAEPPQHIPHISRINLVPATRMNDATAMQFERQPRVLLAGA